MSEVIEAAKRLQLDDEVLCGMGSPYLHEPDRYNRQADLRLVVERVLGADDDDQPALLEWFETMEPARREHIQLYMDEYLGKRRLIVDNGYDSVPLLWDPTRGQVRKVAEALGISLLLFRRKPNGQ